MAEIDTKVLFILGWGRSGTTIIGNVLGEAGDRFHAGELTSIWNDSLVKGNPCGCGRALPDCDIWAGVLEHVNKKVPDLAAAEAAELAYRVTRERNGLRLLRAGPGNVEWPDLSAYLLLAAALYGGVAEATGARLIIDSSKTPTDAAVLGLLPGFDPYYLHVVRDPRATAFSWQRTRLQPQGEGQAQMPRRSVSNSSARWVARNLGAEAIRFRAGGQKYLRLRYEDFVADPAKAARAILDFIGETPTDLPAIDGSTISLAENHTVSGNPGRFHSGPVKLRLDDEWMHRQSRVDRLTATLITAPLLLRYGYPLRPTADSAEMIGQ